MIVSIVSSRRSDRARSAIAAHTLSQVFQRAELKLFHGPFRATKSGRDLTDALLVDEPHSNHLPLEIGQLLDVAIERDPLLDFLKLARIRARREARRVSGGRVRASGPPARSRRSGITRPTQARPAIRSFRSCSTPARIPA